MVMAVFSGISFRPAVALTCPSTDPTENYNCSLGPTYVLPGWGDIASWNEAPYYSTIQLGDIDGDGAAELLGRYADGIQINRFDTDTGLWMPLGKPGLFSDPDGWGAPRFYSTVQLGDINGDGGEELLARSAAGMNTYQWIESEQSWEPLGKPGNPAYSDKAGWGHPQYYSTIQLGDIDGDGKAEMLARSSAGIETHQWNLAEKAWVPYGKQEVPDLSDHFGWDKAKYYSTIQLGDIDADGAEEMITRASVGMITYKWDKTELAWKQVSKQGDPQLSDAAHYDKPEYYSTIQLANICCTEQEELLVRSPQGMDAYVWDGSQWLLLAESSLFSDASGWNKAEYYSTIQLADIDGDRSKEMLARSSAGMEFYKFDNAQHQWIQLGSPGEPALSDNSWKEASRYSTIQTADVDGDGSAKLIARGKFGIRTWFFDSDAKKWERYMPYGFPAVTGGKKAALALLHNVLDLDDTTTVRETYGTDTGALLTHSQGCLFADEKSAAQICGENGKTVSPPTMDCNGKPLKVPAGVTAADWTAVACEIYDELENAKLVASHFSELSSITNTMFIQENSTQEAIIEDLKLDSKKKADGDYDSLFANIFKLVGSIAAPFAPEVGIPLTVAGNAISVAAGAAPSTTSRFSDKTLSTVLNEVSSFQTQLPASNVDHRKYISGDPGLLGMVGQLVQGRWRDLDEIGMLSSSRLGFATWLYQAFLPSLWDKWEITGCSSTAFLRCGPPPDGKYMSKYKKHSTYTDFTGLLPKQTPCKRDGPIGGKYTVTSCSWDTPASDLVDKIWDKISAECQYNGSNAGWDYSNCNVGIGDEVFDWPFKRKKGSPVPDDFASPEEPFPDDIITNDKILDIRDQLESALGQSN